MRLAGVYHCVRTGKQLAFGKLSPEDLEFQADNIDDSIGPDGSEWKNKRKKKKKAVTVDDNSKLSELGDKADD